MRAIFSVVSLLIVLAVVGFIVRSQLHAAKPSAVSGSTPTDSSASAAMTVPTRELPAQVTRDVNAALQDGRARNDAAEAAEKSADKPGERAGDR